MPEVFITCMQAGDLPRIGELARRYGLHALAAPADIEALPPGSAVLCLGEAGLELFTPEAPKERIRADFVRGRTAYRLESMQGTRQPLLEAVGFRSGAELSVLDATAGLGGDGLLLARAGCRVVLCERAPAMAALLEDGLDRARLAGESGLEEVIARRVVLRFMDARGLLQTGERFDVIHLDPMFPPRQKSALVKKEMRLARLVAHEGESELPELLALCRAAAARVVVKRPLRAPPLADGYARQLRGRSIRYDIYT